MERNLVRQVRRFNRAVTQRIGALSEEYLARSRPLGASRVLWEIGDGGADVRAIRSRLDLDSGYLSRLLRGLEDERLVRVQPAQDDHRVRLVRLTEAGRAERAELDRRSDELARQRGELPWVRVDKEYSFDTDEGRVNSVADVSFADFATF